VNREKENERRKDEEPLLILEPGKGLVVLVSKARNLDFEGKIFRVWNHRP